MPIYLDEQTRPELKRILDKWIETHPTDFIAERLQKALEADNFRLQVIRDCKHEPGVYAGEKACCVHCGANYEPGMGEHWSLTEKPFIKAEVEGKPVSPVKQGAPTDTLPLLPND